MKDPLYPEWDDQARADGEARREEAIDRADRGLDDDGRHWCELAIRYAAERRPELTADVVWSLLETWGAPMLREKRALGPIMRAAMTWGWITPLERWQPSAMAICHRREKRVFRSLLYRREARVPIRRIR